MLLFPSKFGRQELDPFGFLPECLLLALNLIGQLLQTLHLLFEFEFQGDFVLPLLANQLALNGDCFTLCVQQILFLGDFAAHLINSLPLFIKLFLA